MLLVILGAAAGLWQWNRALPPVTTAVSPPVLLPFVRVASAEAATPDQILRERAELLDPTPLFFPTERNYRPERREGGDDQLLESAGSLRQPGQVFGSFEPKLQAGEQNMAIFRVEGARAAERLSDLLAQGSEASFAGMGQIDRQRSTLPIRAAFVEVRDLESGNLVISQPLNGISPPRPDFAPVEFLVTVSSAGLVGEPVLTSGSEGEDTDNFFRDYLVQSYRLGERLRPGRYRVVVGA